MIFSQQRLSQITRRFTETSVIHLICYKFVSVNGERPAGDLLGRQRKWLINWNGDTTKYNHESRLMLHSTFTTSDTFKTNSCIATYKYLVFFSFLQILKVIINFEKESKTLTNGTLNWWNSFVVLEKKKVEKNFTDNKIIQYREVEFFFFF